MLVLPVSSKLYGLGQVIHLSLSFCLLNIRINNTLERHRYVMRLKVMIALGTAEKPF